MQWNLKNFILPLREFLQENSWQSTIILKMQCWFFRTNKNIISKIPSVDCHENPCVNSCNDKVKCGILNGYKSVESKSVDLQVWANRSCDAHHALLPQGTQ
ncbi:MAG: hypothetical protein SOW25_08120 [Helicobacter sp.]|nr:hypothetical protein [Helicobacteraceae bacterium]MDY3114270.1 hypothetical protein [Helicobacter sp.]